VRGDDDGKLLGGLAQFVVARDLIRTVCVVITGDRFEVAAVGYVRDPGSEKGDQGYVSIDHLREEPENAKAALLSEVRQVEAALGRASRIAEALGLSANIQRLTKQTERFRTKVESIAAG